MCMVTVLGWLVCCNREQFGKWISPVIDLSVLWVTPFYLVINVQIFSGNRSNTRQDSDQHQHELCVGGAGQPGAGPGEHWQSVDTAGVPGVSGPHHTTHQTMCQGSPGVFRLLSQATSLSHLQEWHVRGEEPGYGAGGQTSQVPLQIPSHGLYRVTQSHTERGTWEKLSFLTTQMSFPWPMFIQWVLVSSGASFESWSPSDTSASPTFRNIVLQSKTLL